jgi:hypothetical protein
VLLEWEREPQDHLVVCRCLDRTMIEKAGTRQEEGEDMQGALEHRD